MKLYIQENDEIKEMDADAFAASFAKRHRVPDHNDEESGESMAAEIVAKGLLSMVSTSQELPEAVANYAKYYKLMEDELKASADLGKAHEAAVKAAKEQAAAEKEQAKQAEEAAKQAIVQRRNVFLEAAERGVSMADDNLRDDIENMRKHLPTGVSVVFNDDASFGLTFGENVKEADLSASMAYFLGEDRNSKFMTGAYQFFIGEIANKLMESNLYGSMIQCGKALSERLLAQGIKLSGRNVESYARMAKRIPIELRNARAESTAYLAISDMPYPKKPVESSFASKDEFKEAMGAWEADKAQVDETRLKLAGYLKAGQVTVQEGDKSVTAEVLTNKDILPYIKHAKIELGLLREEDANKRSVTDWLKQFFEMAVIGELFEGVHKQGVVRVHESEGEATRDLKAKEISELFDEAKAELINIFYGADLPGLQAGEVEREVQIYEEKDGKKTAKKDAEGKPVKETKVFKAYPRVVSL